MMNTPFGKLIEKKSFGKFFLIFTMISLFYGAFANSRAAGCLWDSSLLSGLIGFLYVIMGFLSLILSRLVDTFFSRISLTMQPPPKPHSTACVLPWEEGRHWQSRSSGCSSS